MSTFLQDDDLLSPELDERFRSELAKGERLVWLGQARPFNVMLMAIPIMIFAIPWTAFAIFWTVMASGMGDGLIGMRGAPRPFQAFRLGMGCFGIPFILVGLGMFSAPFWMARKARRTCYALTDRRAIIWTPGLFGGVNVRSFAPRDLGRISRFERADGSGNLIFDEYSARNGQNGGSRTVSVGFMGIRDVRAVEDLLRKTLIPG